MIKRYLIFKSGQLHQNAIPSYQLKIGKRPSPFTFTLQRLIDGRCRGEGSIYHHSPGIKSGNQKQGYRHSLQVQPSLAPSATVIWGKCNRHFAEMSMALSEPKVKPQSKAPSLSQ